MKQITMTQRFGRAAAVGLAGFLVAFAIANFDYHFRGDWGFMRCATAGAFLAGLLFARGLGGQGPRGWFFAGMAFAAATVLGAILAVLLLPLDAALMQTGLMSGASTWSGAGLMGPAYVLGMIVENVGVAFAWIAAFSGIQALVMRFASHEELALNP